ncbi:hypothetical protein PG993_003400 [Apiospora rasikravindrae]|uniref:Galactose oxidase n=1 Tax=Apiospora rasikravindrae TaxID=990691 RepID=A0ABR1TZF7_9PEZI
MSLQIATAMRCSAWVFVWSLLIGVTQAQALPYVPTTIIIPGLSSPDGLNLSADIAYIFAPRDDTVDLLALNVSSTVKAADRTIRTVSSGLPFLTSNNTAFAPTTVDNGSLIVYAGDCNSSSSSELWILNYAAGDGPASWTEIPTPFENGTIYTGPGMLGASMGFSTTLQPTISPATIYTYGGMCPSENSNAAGTQAGGRYSNQMVKISPPGIGGKWILGAPIAEAGFTLTELSPSISNRSGVVTQQVNRVLLGGHTETAFVNMSTAAIWSLPEESWGYVHIDVATESNSRTPFATKSSSEDINPRSGHTAVLNEDGTAIVVFGGWVGDTSTAATPQMVVLEVGAGYGGNGGWQWSVPETQPPGPALYGHGATLLPGNVMMVYGGHAISPSASKARRQTTDLVSDEPQFLNLTTMSWSDAYNNPNYIAAGGVPATTSSDNAKRNLGLGLGLGLGLAAIIGALLVYRCYRWRQSRKYAAREDTIRSLAQDNARFLGDGDDNPMMERHDHPGAWYAGGHDPYHADGQFLGYESYRAASRDSMDGNPGLGLMQAMPIIRKPVAPRAAKGQYRPTSAGTYDSFLDHRTRGAGAIHPIYEDDEDDEARDAEEPMSPSTPVHDTNRHSNHFSNPFSTPTQERQERPLSFPQAARRSGTPSPEPGRRQSVTDPEVQDWMSDVDAADALLTSRMATTPKGNTGKISPVRRNNTVKSTRSAHGPDDESRTGSGVSDVNRSNISRSNSLRINGGSPGFGVGPAVAAAEGRQGTSGSNGSSNSTTSIPSGETYNTARSSFPALQAEGPALLMGRSSLAYEEDDEPGSPSKNRPRRGWLGSLRRVFSGATSTPSPTDSGRTGSPARDNMVETSDYDPRYGGLGSIAAGGLLRRKAGRDAWEASDRQPDTPGKERVSHDDESDEWDIERAVEKRLVQVMFTVPREPLRITNGEPDLESGEDVVIVDPADAVEAKTEADAGADIGEGYHAITTDDVEDAPRPAPLTIPRFSSKDSNKEKQQQQQQQQHGLARLVSSSSSSNSSNSKYPSRETADSALGTEIASPISESGRPPSSGSHDLLAVPEERYDTVSTPSRKSFDVGSDLEVRPSLGSGHSEGELLSAEAVTIERPRSRVLAMVERYEGKSRSPSPDRP